MNITCQNCEELIGAYLCDVPSKWKDNIAKAICSSLNEQDTIDCKKVKSCETLTSLSAFSVVGTTICITYKDEHGHSFNRCFDWKDLSDCPLDGTDPKCITDQETWDAMTCQEKIQTIIDFACNCTTVTTTTTTTLLVFDTILEFSSNNQDSSDGVTATILGTDPVMEFQFDAIALPIGAPMTVEINVSSVLRMIVDYPDEYDGQPFRFINSTGLIYYGVFTNGTLNF